jgi:hypothetical protein
MINKIKKLLTITILFVTVCLLSNNICAQSYENTWKEFSEGKIYSVEDYKKSPIGKITMTISNGEEFCTIKSTDGIFLKMRIESIKNRDTYRTVFGKVIKENGIDNYSVPFSEPSASVVLYKRHNNTFIEVGLGPIKIRSGHITDSWDW